MSSLLQVAGVVLPEEKQTLGVSRNFGWDPPPTPLRPIPPSLRHPLGTV